MKEQRDWRQSVRGPATQQKKNWVVVGCKLWPERGLGGGVKLGGAHVKPGFRSLMGVGFFFWRSLVRYYH